MLVSGPLWKSACSLIATLPTLALFWRLVNNPSIAPVGLVIHKPGRVECNVLLASNIASGFMRAVEIIHSQPTWMSTTDEHYSSTKSPLKFRDDINFFAGQRLLRNQEKNDLQYSYVGSEFLSCSPIHSKDSLHTCTENIEDFEEFPIRKPRKSKCCSVLLSDQGHQSDTGISSNTVPVIV